MQVERSIRQAPLEIRVSVALETPCNGFDIHRYLNSLGNLTHMERCSR